MRIRAEHLTKRVPSHITDDLTQKAITKPDTLTILQDISLEVDSGESLAIMGISGSGKSTLLGLLAGLDLPSSGQVFWDEQKLSLLDEDGRAKARLHKAGFIFQNFELLPAYTALENVLLPLELVQKEGAINLAKKSLAEVGLAHRMHHYPNQLSGGEQQRVAIARAFAIEPAILFADEPTGNLDQSTGAQIIKLIFDLNQKHRTTIICVTHDPALSNSCKRTLHISGGRLEVGD